MMCVQAQEAGQGRGAHQRRALHCGLHDAIIRSIDEPERNAPVCVSRCRMCVVCLVPLNPSCTSVRPRLEFSYLIRNARPRPHRMVAPHQIASGNAPEVIALMVNMAVAPSRISARRAGLRVRAG